MWGKFVPELRGRNNVSTLSSKNLRINKNLYHETNATSTQNITSLHCILKCFNKRY
jgi:hypothetical protein